MRYIAMNLSKPACLVPGRELLISLTFGTTRDGNWKIETLSLASVRVPRFG
jgi:hypothetical protein